MAEKTGYKKTTIAVSCETGKALSVFCEKIGCQKNEFVEASLKYFRKHELDPRTADIPTKQEIDILMKRMEQFFGFIKQHEKTMFERIDNMSLKYDKLDSKINKLFIDNFKK